MEQTARMEVEPEEMGFWKDLRDALVSLLSSEVAFFWQGAGARPDHFVIEPIAAKPCGHEECRSWRRCPNKGVPVLGLDTRVVRCPWNHGEAASSEATHPICGNCFSIPAKVMEFFHWLCKHPDVDNSANASDDSHLVPYYAAGDEVYDAMEMELHKIFLGTLIRELREPRTGEDAWPATERVHGILNWSDALPENCSEVLVQEMTNCKRRRLHGRQIDESHTSCSICAHQRRCERRMYLARIGYHPTPGEPSAPSHQRREPNAPPLH